MMFNKTLLFPLIALCLLAYTSLSHAECARDDVDHYLSKGFTPEQITKICATSPIATAPPVENASHKLLDPPIPEKTPLADSTSEQITSHEKNKQFLQEVIKGRDIVLTNDSLQYTLKTCIEYDEEDQYGFAPKACPFIKYTIALKDLEVITSRKKYIFFGTDQIKVKSDISREILGGLKKYKAEEKRKIIKKLESGDHTIIPIRDDIPLEQVEHVLMKLAI